MAGARTSKLDRIKFKLFPFMYKICPAGNYHKIGDRLCFCRCNEYADDWHGGVLDFKTGKEYIPYNDILGRSLHDVWQEVTPFLRRTADKSISDYESVEDVLIAFMGFVGVSRTDDSPRINFSKHMRK